MTADQVGDVLTLAWAGIVLIIGAVLLAGCFCGDRK